MRSRGDRDAPPMKRMDGMRPVAPVRPAAPAASPEEAPAQMVGGARPIPATPAAIAGAEIGAEGDAVTSPDAGSEKAPPEAQLLRVYHAVVCHRRRGDESGVQALWAQHGYTAGTWAETMRDAVMRAEEDSDDFGKAWAEVLRRPCVP